MKKLLKSFLASRGYEICKLWDSEKRQIPLVDRFTFRESQCYKALGNLGQISIEESRLLGEIVAASDPGRPIIEIGTLFGSSALVIALFKHTSQELITVDNYSWNPLGLSPLAHESITRNRLKEAISTQNVRMVTLPKEEFYSSYKGPPPSLFFCDADHSYEATKADILWARSVGASIICGDDYDDDPRTAKAVDELGGPKRLAGGLFVM